MGGNQSSGGSFFLWGLELDDLSGPFQPKPLYDSTKMPAELYGKSRGEKAFILHSLAEALFNYEVKSL